MAQLALASVCYFYLLRALITWSNEMQVLKARKLWHFLLTRFALVKYSRALVERPSQGTSSLASQLTTMSLDHHVRRCFQLILQHVAVEEAADV